MTLLEDAKAFMEMKGAAMTFEEYQKFCKTTAIYPDDTKLMYPALGLNGEAGEVANKIKKLVRDGVPKTRDELAAVKEQIAAELGDVLWYCAALATDLDISLGRIAKNNMDKLSSRKERGKIGGSGDNR
ncbi:MAG: nucleoside triphosphate pyrophosphohydrolase family protein [Pelagibacteraceae bacterium]